MYTEQDYQNAKIRKNQRLLFALAFALLALVFLGTGLVVRNKYLAICGCVASGWVFYFMLDMLAMPLVRYDRFLRDVRQGRSRVSTVSFASVGEQPRLQNGVAFYDVLTKDGEDTERLFYYDAKKELPKLLPGQPIAIESFGNYIIKIERA